ncbi:DUF4760 domain-containing protein [Nocardia abscessus]|uniref:DUF4760 domain-containing protein n=1 Tax=Nocardia abscessus TaxID=120957 RepID=UPI0005BA4F68|nr:DUF4760 domain-containing protein [Nocardia abscessus]MCC3331370.1 DUF4760 domain-containing protein [Nocardia abscessus]
MTVFEGCTLIVSACSLLVSGAAIFLLIGQLKLLRQQVDDARRSLDQSTKQAVLAAEQAAEENRRVRQAETLKFMATTLPQQHELQNEVPILESDTRYPAFLEAALVPDSDDFHKLRRLMSLYETFATAVNMNVFDYTLLERTSGSRFKRVAEMYSSWVTAERKRIQRPALYIELETLAARLSGRASLNGTAPLGASAPARGLPLESAPAAD